MATFPLFVSFTSSQFQKIVQSSTNLKMDNIA